jgi:predicted O-methyltransferase YrrM
MKTIKLKGIKNFLTLLANYRRVASRYIIYVLLKAFFCIHKLAIRIGVHVLPVHYFSEIPNILELEKSINVWAKKSDLPGLSIDLDEQVNNLRTICLNYQNEYVGNKVFKEAILKMSMLEYGYIEAQALHSIIRYYKPRKVIEVGSGISTYCMLAALELNKREMGQSSELTCIEPYRSDKLKALIGIKLIPEIVQSIPFEVFTELQEGDMLFIDSTHTVKPAGDVNYLILEVLPRLHKGVIVQFHDIFLPYDYQPNILQSFFHWTETSLLRAFLIFNDRVKIIFCLTQLHFDRSNALKEVFPDYNPSSNVDGLQDPRHKPFKRSELLINLHYPCSIYIKM